MGCNFNFN